MIIPSHSSHHFDGGPADFGDDYCCAQCRHSDIAPLGGLIGCFYVVGVIACTAQLAGRLHALKLLLGWFCEFIRGILDVISFGDQTTIGITSTRPALGFAIRIVSLLWVVLRVAEFAVPWRVKFSAGASVRDRVTFAVDGNPHRSVESARLRLNGLLLVRSQLPAWFFRFSGLC
jgi:hypothetical protein